MQRALSYRVKGTSLELTGRAIDDLSTQSALTDIPELEEPNSFAEGGRRSVADTPPLEACRSPCAMTASPSPLLHPATLTSDMCADGCFFLEGAGLGEGFFDHSQLPTWHPQLDLEPWLPPPRLPGDDSILPQDCFDAHQQECFDAATNECERPHQECFDAVPQECFEAQLEGLDDSLPHCCPIQDFDCVLDTGIETGIDPGTELSSEWIPLDAMPWEPLPSNANQPGWDLGPEVGELELWDACGGPPDGEAIERLHGSAVDRLLEALLEGNSEYAACSRPGRQKHDRRWQRKDGDQARRMSAEERAEIAALCVPIEAIDEAVLAAEGDFVINIPGCSSACPDEPSEAAAHVHLQEPLQPWGGDYDECKWDDASWESSYTAPVRQPRDRPSCEVYSAKSSVECTNTTVMVRNIPNKYTREMFVEQLHSRFHCRFDFVYLPIDFGNKCNVGYGFVNFRSPQDCVHFVEQFNGAEVQACLPGVNSRKVIEVTPARVQGLDANVRRLRRSAVMNVLVDHPEWMPLLFNEEGSEMSFPMPDEFVPEIKPRKPRRMWEESSYRETQDKTYWGGRRYRRGGW